MVRQWLSGVAAGSATVTGCLIALVPNFLLQTAQAEDYLAELTEPLVCSKVAPRNRGHVPARCVRSSR